jgi:hypothetical protein
MSLFYFIYLFIQTKLKKKSSFLKNEIFYSLYDDGVEINLKKETKIIKLFI